MAIINDWGLRRAKKGYVSQLTEDFFSALIGLIFFIYGFGSSRERVVDGLNSSGAEMPALIA